MAKYKQITQEERYQIAALLAAGFNQSYIAAQLSRDKSTISREISRNKGPPGYQSVVCPKLASDERHW